MSKILSVQLSDEEYNLLEEASKLQDRSKGYMLRQCMRQYLEDFIDARNADKIFKEVKSGKMKTVKWEDVKKELRTKK